MATIQFSRGIDETVVPDVKLTRSKDGSRGTATFIFEQPDAFSGSGIEAITGMFMIDEEGEMVTRDVKGRFINGQPSALEVLYIINSPAEWDRFIRFMERYGESNGLGFQKKGE
jgi:photosystem II 13kDa protein